MNIDGEERNDVNDINVEIDLGGKDSKNKNEADSVMEDNEKGKGVGDHKDFIERNVEPEYRLRTNIEEGVLNEEMKPGIINIDRQNSSSEENLWSKIPEPTLCIRKYVIVKYNSKLYPGVVKESGEDELLVQCMHQVGRKKREPFFLAKDPG